MAVVFFEGFNFAGETTTLNPAYWSNVGGFWFGNGRTGSGVRLPNRAEGAALADNSRLTLSNFTDPLSSAGGSNTCVGVGFWVDSRGVRQGKPVGASASAPHTENLISLTTSNGAVSVDCDRASDGGGVLLSVRENGTLINSYDFRSIAGNTFNINADLGGVITMLNSVYLDLFFDAANGAFSVRAGGNSTLSAPLTNLSGSATTAITPFSSLTAVTLYGAQAYTDYGLVERGFDDFYLTTGNALADVYLGPNTRIYRLTAESQLSRENWLYSQNYYEWQAHEAVNSNNGDGSYVRSATSGATATYAFTNLPGDAPAYVSGVKLINVARKAGLANRAIVNVMASASGGEVQEIGPTYSITAESYATKEQMFLTNPLTSGTWNPAAINDVVFGIKDKS